MGAIGSGSEPTLPIPLAFHAHLGVAALRLAALAVGSALAQQRVVVEQVAVRWRRLFRLFHGHNSRLSDWGAYWTINRGKSAAISGLRPRYTARKELPQRHPGRRRAQPPKSKQSLPLIVMSQKEKTMVTDLFSCGGQVVQFELIIDDLTMATRSPGVLGR